MTMLASLARCLLVLPLMLAGKETLPARADQSGSAEIRAVFADVQQGITDANVSLFSSHFHSQVRVTLRGGETGLYSANQAYYLIENFLRVRKPLTFSFTTYGESANTPFATGSAGYTYHGTRQHVQVYVALASAGEHWVITHINIY